MSNDAKKKIFISDIHMGDDRSFKGEYGWFLGDNISKLAGFLGGLKKQ